MAKTTLSIVLRVVVQLSAVTAAIVMLLSRDYKTNNPRAISCIGVNFYGWDTYFIAAQFIACSLNFIFVLLPSNSKLWSPIFWVDMVVLMMQLTSWTSILVCLMHMKSEHPHLGLPSVCNVARGLCNMILGALISAGIACFSNFLFVCYCQQKVLNILILSDD